MIKRFIQFLLCVAVMLMSASALAQDATPIPLNIDQDLYNHESGWHIRIPAGWTNESTADYARFTLDGEMIFVSESVENNADDAVRETIGEAGLDAAMESNSYSVLTLNNGQWTQHLFGTDVVGTPRLSAHTQQYEDRFYVLLYITSAGSQPIIVPTDNPAVGVADAIRQYNPTQSVTSADIPVDGDNPQRATYTLDLSSGGEALTAIGRTISSSTFVIVGTASQADLIEHSIYFTLLNDFFITPNTQPYLWLGLALGFGVLAILIVSLIVRYQNLKRDEAALNQVMSDP